jgi:predicted acylesterase/phospholipase RssA
VLTGGGSLGATHVGMLQALFEKEIIPDLIVGTSVGAINGAYIASRPQTKQTAVERNCPWSTVTSPRTKPGCMPLGGLISSTGLLRLPRAGIQDPTLSPPPHHPVQPIPVLTWRAEIELRIVETSISGKLESHHRRTSQTGRVESSLAREGAAGPAGRTESTSSVECEGCCIRRLSA